MKKTAERIARLHADELDGLDRKVYVLSDGTAGGPDGMLGLNLVSKCMSNYFDEWGAPLDLAVGGKPEVPNSEAASLSKQLRKLAMTKGGWFVVCYEVPGRDKWRMAWSDSLDPSEAYEVMREYLSQIL